MSNILNLDKVLSIFYGKNIFTDLNNYEYKKTVDVRSLEEYKSFPLLQYNIPVINKKEHQFLHRHLYLAGIIVFYGLFKNRHSIKKELLKISNNKKDKILIGCSKGRLRSPAIWLYAKFLGIDAKILRNGVKNYKNIIFPKNKKISGD